jgi:uncharacterized damage-inducible protein DinB
MEEALRHLQPESGAKLWHGGATVLGALRGVSPAVAAWRPYPDRHSIWALGLHVAYWNYAVWRRITGAPKGGFPRDPSNFPTVPDPPTQAAWDADRSLVREWHDRLVAAWQDFDAARLDDVVDGDAKWTYADLMTGILMHDTYHAGQIQMLKRLARSEGL